MCNEDENLFGSTWWKVVSLVFTSLDLNLPVGTD